MGLLMFVWTFALGAASMLFALGYALFLISKPTPMDPKRRAVIETDTEKKDSIRRGEPEGYRDLKGAEFFEKDTIGIKAVYSGWITVTNEFYKFPQLESLESPPKPVNEETTISGVTSIFKGRKNNTKTKTDEEEDPALKTSNQLKAIRRRHRFYCVLKHGNLFLYSDESKSKTKAVIVLSRFLVSVWPRDLKENQLFTKRSAICLINKEGLSPLDLEALLSNSDETTVLPDGSHFLYSDTHYEKENLYLTLLTAMKRQDSKPNGTMDDIFDPTLIAKTLHFKTADMNELIQTLNSTEGQLTTKWLNAIIGRLFLAVNDTPEFEEACINFIDIRLKKIRMPGFLDDLQIQRIKVGRSAPFFTNPRLKAMSPEGDLDVIFNFLYQGGFVVEIATKIFLNLTGFKQREFDVILKVTLKKIKGDILLRLKPQPSNRIWYAFTETPEMDLEIEPVFSSRALNYAIVTNMIQKQFREALNQSLVMPFMDNIAFYDTSDELFRAGIWDKKFRQSLGTLDTEIRDMESDIPPSLPPIKTEIFLSTDSASINTTDGVDNFNSVRSSKSMKMSSSMGQQSAEDIEINIKRSASVNDDLDNETLNSASSDSKLKQKVSNSYSMLKQWYSKKSNLNNSSESDLMNGIQESAHTEFKDNNYGSQNSRQDQLFNPLKEAKTESLKKNPSTYTPPEMISNRRSKTSRASAGSASLSAVIDSINNSDHKKSPERMISPTSPEQPSSPQMFVRGSQAESLSTPPRKRHPSGSFNIYTASADQGGILALGEEESPAIDMPIKHSSDSLQAIVNNTHELGKIPTTIEENRESDKVSLNSSNHLRRKPPPQLPPRDNEIF